MSVGRTGAGRSVEPIERGVDRRGTRPALGNGPDNQALASPHVAARVDTVDRGGPAVVASHIPLGVEVDSELVDHAFELGPAEPEHEQHEISG